MNEQSKAAPDASSVFHVSINAAGVVEVDGGTPAEIVALLQQAGNQVAIIGDLTAGIEPDPTMVEEVERLSERELEILVLIATGRANQEVAEEMYISVNTVKTYIRSAYRKMGVASRSQAVIWAIDHGVVDTHPHQN